MLIIFLRKSGGDLRIEAVLAHHLFMKQVYCPVLARRRLVEFVLYTAYDVSG